MTNNLSSTEKIRLLKIELDQIKDLNIDKYFNLYTELNKKKTFVEGQIEDKSIKDKLIEDKNNKVSTKSPEKRKINIDKNSTKYIVVLKLLNKILSECDRKPINDIFEFKSMTKNQITKNPDVNNLFDLEEEIFTKDCFDRRECKWHMKKNIKNYIFTFLKCACKEFNVKFFNEFKKKTKNNIIHNYVEYSIIP